MGGTLDTMTPCLPIDPNAGVDYWTDLTTDL